MEIKNRNIFRMAFLSLRKNDIYLNLKITLYRINLLFLIVLVVLLITVVLSYANNNLIKGLIFSLFLNALLYSFIGLFYLLGVNRFRGFFGCKNRLIVYLSNWFDRTKITNGSNYTLGFVTEKELSLQNTLREFLNRENTLFNMIVSKLKRIMCRERNDIEMIIKASPLPGDLIPNDSPMVIIGSSVANYARSFFVKKGITKATFENEIDQIPNSSSKIISNKLIVHSENGNHIIEGNDNVFINAFIEKTYQNGKTIIFCCGYTGEATDFVTRYLINNWQDIAKRYREKAFLLCIGVQVIKGKENEKNSNNFVILYEKSWDK